MDITDILVAIVSVAVTVITACVIPWMKGKMSEQDLDNLLVWVDIAVRAAQQMYHQKDGTIRKQYVLDFLSAKGFDVDSEEVDNAIEAAVLQVHKELGL